jgi:hypothetical protein
VGKRQPPRQLRLNVYRSRGGATVPPGELLVEYFSDRDLIAWRSRGKHIQDYHYLWYFELESQRASAQTEILEALNRVAGISIDLAGWGRGMAYRYSATPLSCVGSLKWVGGRFNYGVDIDKTRFAPFPALYLAEDMETGLREMQGLTRETTRAGLSANELNLCSERGVAWVALSGKVSNIFDLTHPGSLAGLVRVLSKFRLSKRVRDVEKKLGAHPLKLVTSAHELFDTVMTESWREFPTLVNTPSNSQLLGHLLTLAGFEGVVYASTRTGKKNLALFTRQFKNSTSIVRAVSPPATATQCELSASTFRNLEHLPRSRA